METNNQNQKTEPSADKALAELIRTKVLDFVHGMKKLCNDNGLSFCISGWVEDPVNRGDSPEKTLKFRCGNANPLPMLVHKIIDISVMFKDFVEKTSYKEVSCLCTMAENLIGYVCKKIMTKLDEKSKTKEK